MTDATKAVEGEQPTNQKQTYLDQIRDRADWTELGQLLIAVAVGLAVNTAVILAAIGGSPGEIGGGIAYLTPAAFIGAAIYHQKGGVDIPYVSGAALFCTILAANSVALIARMIQTGTLGSEPGMMVFVVLVVAAMFSPGPFIAAWAARRWWI